MSNLVQGAYPVFTDIDGDPIEDGFIFIGEPALDPIANPISVFWDEALTVPATNIRTKGGYPLNSGAPGRLFVAGTYSIIIQNKRAITVYSQTTFFESGAELRLDTGGSTTIIEGLSAIKSGSNQLRVSARWEDASKIFSGQISIEEPNNSFTVRDGIGTIVDLKALTYTIAGSQSFSKRIQFNIDVAAGTPFAGLSASALVFVGASTDGSGKLVIN